MVGGAAPPGPRAINITLQCDPTVTGPPVFVPGSFVQPTTTGHVPNTPYYFGLTLLTSSVCTICTEIDCLSCTKNSSCEWCRDGGNEGCRSTRSMCQNWIKNPKFCPNCSAEECKACVSNPSCEWCLSEGCKSSDYTCSNGRVIDPTLCPA